MPLLKNLGESEVIRRLQTYIDPSTLLGSNEDAYLYNDSLPYVLVNVDTMARSSDFLPQQSWTQIGAKLVTMTFSDLAAKGATPEVFISSLVLEDTMEEIDLKKLVHSIQKSSHKFGARYLGGDLGSANESVLTGIGLGSIITGKILAREGARKGDLVCVTGTFGLTSVGLDHLLSPKARRFEDISDENMKKAIQRLYEPEPRITEGSLLSKFGLASASIDSSDGLAISLHWLSLASNIGIYIKQLPIDPILESYIKSEKEILEIVMFGGEEYELVFTIAPSKLEELEEVFKQHNCQFHVIGECGGVEGVKFKNQSIPMKGWDTFRKKTY